jgi:hypothetical protein
MRLNAKSISEKPERHERQIHFPKLDLTQVPGRHAHPGCKHFLRQLDPLAKSPSVRADVGLEGGIEGATGHFRSVARAASLNKAVKVA